MLTLYFLADTCLVTADLSFATVIPCRGELKALGKIFKAALQEAHLGSPAFTERALPPATTEQVNTHVRSPLITGFGFQNKQWHIHDCEPPLCFAKTPADLIAGEALLEIKRRLRNKYALGHGEDVAALWLDKLLDWCATPERYAQDSAKESPGLSAGSPFISGILQALGQENPCPNLNETMLAASEAIRNFRLGVRDLSGLVPELSTVTILKSDIRSLASALQDFIVRQPAHPSAPSALGAMRELADRKYVPFYLDQLRLHYAARRYHAACQVDSALDYTGYDTPFNYWAEPHTRETFWPAVEHFLKLNHNALGEK